MFQQTNTIRNVMLSGKLQNLQTIKRIIKIITVPGLGYLVMVPACLSMLNIYFFLSGHCLFV